MLPTIEIASRIFASRCAETDADISEARRMRFKVYCEEAQYFDPQSYPDGQEVDAYDSRSLEGLLVIRQTDATIGSARLILPTGETDSPYQLPFDAVCDPTMVDGEKIFPRETTAELSRFCVTLDSVPLINEVLRNGDLPAVDIMDVARCAKLWLMRAVLEMSNKVNLTHWCAVMDPRFLQNLLSLGIEFQHIGPPVEYYGQRQPCYGQIEVVLGKLKRERSEIWNIVTDSGRFAP